MSTNRTNKIKLLVGRFQEFEESYIDSLADLDLDLGLAEDTFCSGWVCMLFMISLPTKLKEVRDNIRWDEVYDRNIAYIKLYLLVDHYMDSKDTSEKDKTRMIKWLLDENRIPTEEIHHKIIGPFSELTKTQRDKEQMKLLIKITIEGIKLQREKNASYEDYMKAALSKGGYTVLVGTRLIYGDQLDCLSDEELLYLGGVTQLLDDMIDTSSDIKEGINTVCTYAKRTRGNCNVVARKLVEMNSKLPPHFGHYQKFMLFAAKYVVLKSQHYSDSFKTQMTTGFFLSPDEIYAYKRKEESKFRKMYLNRRKSKTCGNCGSKCVH